MSGTGVSERMDGTGIVASSPAPRKIWLCADDYGISPAVNHAIRDLVGHGRINATSVMVVAPTFHRSEAASLNALRVHGARVAVGLHLTLSAPFQPLTQGFTPLVNKAFPTYRMMLVRAWLRQLDRKALEAEVAAQIRMFGHEFGRAPDFIDGHQHVHIFPQVRDALFAVARKMAPIAWIRQCGRTGTLSQTDRRSEGARARPFEQEIPRARRGAGRAHQYRLRRHLCFQRQRGLCGVVPAFPQ